MVQVVEDNPFLVAEVVPEPISTNPGMTAVELEALMRVLRELFEQYNYLLPKPLKTMTAVHTEESPDGCLN